MGGLIQNLTAPLEQITKLFDGQAGISGDTAHGECVDRIMTRDRQDALAVAHNDVFPLAHNPKSGLFECAHSVKMVDARDFWQG